jgi:hypothetical protein
MPLAQQSTLELSDEAQVRMMLNQERESVAHARVYSLGIADVYLPRATMRDRGDRGC